jgi:hypothetical protein
LEELLRKDIDDQAKSMKYMDALRDKIMSTSKEKSNKKK